MRYLAVSFILLAAMVAGGDAAGQPGRARQGVQSGQMQSLGSIVSNIRRSQPGRLSDVQGPVNGQYRIKWLTPDGRVFWFNTDARTGRVLGVQGGERAPFGR